MNKYLGKLIINKRLVPLVLASMPLVGCITTSSKYGAAGEGGMMPQSSVARSGVVSQIGARDPLLAPHPRNYWLDQRQAKAMMPRAQAALATGEPELVVNMAKAKLARTPGDPGALTMLAAALTMSHQYDLAAYYAGQLEQVQPGNSFALNVKGIAAMLAHKTTMSDYRMAQEYFQKAMDNDPMQIAAGLNLGSLQLELGNARGAATVFKTVAERCGECTAAQIGYGRALTRSGEFKEAAEVFKDVLKKHPENPAAQYNLALVYKNGFHDKPKAQSYLMAVIKNSHNRDQGLKNRAQIVLRSLSGQKAMDERARLAADPAPSADEADAAILMTGAEGESEEP